MKMCAQDIEFTLIRSDRKTADIVIERSGDVIVRAPAGIDDEKLREAVADRALWVHRSLAEWEDLNSSRRLRPLVQGQGFCLSWSILSIEVHCRCRGSVAPQERALGVVRSLRRQRRGACRTKGVSRFLYS